MTYFTANWIHSNAIRFRKRSLWLDLACAVACSTFWFFWLSRNGIALSPDSTNYLFYSLQIFHGFDFSGIPAVWPPAYPAMLAIPLVFQPSPVMAATVVSTVSLFLTLLFLSLTLASSGVGVVARILGVALLFLNPYFLYIHDKAWSEAPFAALTSILIFTLVRHLQTRHASLLVFAAVLVAAIALTRYLGYFAIALYCLFLAHHYLTSDRRPHLRTMIFLFLMAASPSFLWMLRNFWSSGTAHGPRSPATVSLAENVEVFSSFLVWGVMPLIYVCIVLLPLLIMTSLYEFRSGAASALRRNGDLLLVVTAIVLYVALVLYSSTVAEFDPVSTRFSAPVFPLITLLIVLSVSRSADRLVDDKSPTSATGVAALSHWVLIVFSTFTFIKHAHPYFSDTFASTPLRHTDLGFRKSNTVRDIQVWTARRLSSDSHDLKLHVFLDPRDDWTLGTRPEVGRALLFRSEIFLPYRVVRYIPEENNLKVILRSDGPDRNVQYVFSRADAGSILQYPIGQYLILADKENFERIRSMYPQFESCLVESVGSLFALDCGNLPEMHRAGK